MQIRQNEGDRLQQIDLPFLFRGYSTFPTILTVQCTRNLPICLKLEFVRWRLPNVDAQDQQPSFKPIASFDVMDIQALIFSIDLLFRLGLGYRACDFDSSSSKIQVTSQVEKKTNQLSRINEMPLSLPAV